VDERDEGLLGIARTQHGVWTLAQAIACGFTRPAIRRRVEQGRWEELQPRVYRLFAPAVPEFRQALMALVLATGGVAARGSAAALHGWLPPGRPEVAIRRAARRNSHRGVAITDTLDPPDVCVVDGIPTTSVVRTLIDLAAFVPRGRFEDLFDAVIAGGGVKLPRLETRARELTAPRRSGCAVVLQLVAETSRDAVRARNGWEASVLRTIGVWVSLRRE
jgi:hypothetical protein